MLAWHITQYGDFRDVLRIAGDAADKPEGGPAILHVEAVGLNFLDILAIAGKYQERGPLPFTPGVEAAGEVVETAAGSPFRIGDRVMTFGNAACAEYMRAAASTTFGLPDNMSYEAAAAFQLVYQTAYTALVHRAGLQAGELLLVHAGAGGVGTAAIQVGRAVGARVVATAGSVEKCDICRHAGAEVAVNYREDDFCETVRNISNGRGADVIFDPVGGTVFDDSSRCIAFEGRIITVGYASGRIPSIAANRILLKNMDVIGLFWGNYSRFDPLRIERTQAELYRLWQDGIIEPVIYRRFDFEDLPEALAALAERKSFGKIVLGGPHRNS